MGNIAPDNVFPCGRKWSRSDLFAAAIGKPLKHVDSLQKILNI
jgi:hypothetical protein